MDVTSVWWSFPPYTDHSPVKDGIKSWPVGGVIGEEIPAMLNFCHVNPTKQIQQTEVASPNHFGRFLLEENSNSSLTLMFPYSRSLTMAIVSDRDLCFLPLVESPGSVYFYKSGSKPVGSDLLTVLVEGWPMIILILLGASYAGIIIWLLDRMWNPSNFPRPFIRGFWEGFWWAFVTMTTVGYGDTTPRSIQARVFGLIWIIIGVTILSVFTATVTTVMTQQAVSVLQTLQGRRITAVNGSEDFVLALSKGAKVIAASTMDDVVNLIESRQVDGALLDYYSMAANMEDLAAMVVEGTMQHATLHGIMVRGGDHTLYRCLNRYVEANRKAILTRLAGRISHHKLHIAFEKAHGLFQPKTINYMLFCLAAWVVVFLCFVMWEFFYWRPKHRMKKENKSDGTGQSEPNSSLGMKQSETPQEIQDVSTSVTSNVPRLPDVPVSYTNNGFLADGESRPTWPKQRQTVANYHHSLTRLDHLIHCQNAELLALEEEFANYKRGWEKRLARTKARHRKEQISLMRMFQNTQSETVENGRADSFLYVSSQSTLFNSNSFRVNRTSVRRDILNDTINYL